MCRQKPALSDVLSDDVDSTSFQPIIEIELPGDYPEKDLFLQDIADVRYVPLETSDQSVLRNFHSIAMRDDRIVITDLADQIVVFDSAGRYVSKIYEKGPGPHQYQYIAASAVDFDKQLVYIDDIFGIKVYDFDGYFVRKLSKDDYTSASMLYLCDSTRLIAYYETNGKKDEGDTLRGHYFFIDTETGARTPVGIDITEPASNSLMVYEEVADGMVARSKGVPIHTMLKTDGKVIISDYVFPSVFECGADGLKQIIERHVSDDGRWLTSVFLISDPYIMFRAIRISGEDNLKSYKMEERNDFIFDRRTQTITKGYIINRDQDGEMAFFVEGWKNDLPKNKLVTSISTEELALLNDLGKLSGPLKSIADTIDAEANNILMIATLKSK